MNSKTQTAQQKQMQESNKLLISQKHWMLRRIIYAMNVINIMMGVLTIPFMGEKAKVFIIVAIAQIVFGISAILVRKNYYNHTGILTSTLLSAVIFMGVVILSEAPFFLHALLVPLILASFVTRFKFIWILFAVQSIGLIVSYFYLHANNLQNMQMAYYGLTFTSNFVFTTWVFLNNKVHFSHAQQLIEINHTLEASRDNEHILRTKAEEANVIKSQFLATMSHELRTPLNAIIGYSEILGEDLADHQNVEQTCFDDLERINQSGRHLLEMISGILDMSKLEAGHISIHVETFSVQSILREIQEVIMPMAKTQNNTIVIELDDQKMTIHSDRIKVRQILLNLTSNAVKFTQNGRITLSASAKDNTVVFDVEDTGIGIAPEDQDRIFEEFVQADDSSTRIYSGTGLGLSLCNRFSKLLGGRIELKSAPGMGSTFSVFIPQNIENRTQT